MRSLVLTLLVTIATCDQLFFVNGQEGVTWSWNDSRCKCQCDKHVEWDKNIWSYKGDCKTLDSDTLQPWCYVHKTNKNDCSDLITSGLTGFYDPPFYSKEACRNRGIKDYCRKMYYDRRSYTYKPAGQTVVIANPVPTTHQTVVYQRPVYYKRRPGDLGSTAVLGASLLGIGAGLASLLGGSDRSSNINGGSTFSDTHIPVVGDRHNIIGSKPAVHYKNSASTAVIRNSPSGHKVSSQDDFGEY